MCLFKFDRNNILFISFFHIKSPPLHPLCYSRNNKKHQQKKNMENSLVLSTLYRFRTKKVYTVYYHTNKFLTLFHACDSASAHNWSSQFMNMSVTYNKKKLSDLSSALASAQLNSSAPLFRLLYSLYLYTFFFLCSYIAIRIHSLVYSGGDL